MTGRDARRWGVAFTVAAAVHLALLMGLGVIRPVARSAPAIEPVMIEMVEPRPLPPPEPPLPPIATPEPGGAPAAEAESEPAAPTPQPATPAPARPRVAATPPPNVETAATAPVLAPPGPPLPLLGADQLAGALTAGNGGGGGGSGTGTGGGSGAGVGACDMVKRVQDRLRATPSVGAAVAEAERTSNASGRAMLIWNGDWLQSGAQAGKGLAGVRQAIALEVAFAPAECRGQAVRGLAVLSLSDGGPRLALGRAAWRWSDLLGV